MSLENKRLFVEKAYTILKEEGFESVKIRRLASELNCTSTVIYRYFDNLEHLIALASIPFLNEYIIDYKNLISDPQILTDPYGLNLRIWDCLAGHAFKNIHIYENLFFGQYQYSLGDIIFEYHQMYLENSKEGFNGYSISVLFNDDLFQRDYVLLRRAAALGTIRMRDAEIVSQFEYHLFRSIMLKYKNEYKQPGIPEKAAAEFSWLIHELADKYRKA